MNDINITDWLNELAGEKLSSVVFVMDYLQLDFDGNRYTMYIWPEVIIEEKVFHFSGEQYRNKLCALITQVVKHVVYKERQSLEIHFVDGNQIRLSLNPNNPDIVAEIGIYTDASEAWMVLE
ncbi:hypothetical protein PK28_11945 [Hymenobacter sp. DG25B]|uniref:hypothetical protein n=1 Tax=Hymenobacter sp. DG25B TaxID=1385664 RepID=UPI00054126B0|nr:hypothetical protein [Hymenobacter sp. DG25B]AIZ64219.1 hypothetical protein PK28_11945 [Hymenobacter sp. DG25B]